MYQTHTSFEVPKDENTKIWRYIDFPKLVSMLDTNALFFTKADILAKKFDKYEGLYTNALIRQMRKISKNDEIFKARFRDFQAQKNTFIINCWHINNYESDAMWKLYCPSGKGIAIQSTFRRLTKSFDNYLDKDVQIGKVKYIDYDEDYQPFGNAFIPYLHKRKYFEYENELRAIIWTISVPKNGKYKPIIIKGDGHLINVDLSTLIESIYLPPQSHEWIYKTIKSVCEKYRFSFNIKKSTMDEEPPQI